MAIKNFCWVIPDKLAGSAMPGRHGRGGESVLEDLKELVSNKIQVLVSLERPGGPIEQLCDEVGLVWKYFPIPDYQIPDHLPKFDQLTKDIVRCLNEEKAICVHCRAGIGRTGLVLTCAVGKYLALRAGAALAAVRRVRSAIDTPEQEQFVREYLDSYEN